MVQRNDDDTLPFDEPDVARTLDSNLSESPPESCPPELADHGISMRERVALRGLHSSGGIGEVWRAYDKVLDREIALKRLRPEQGEVDKIRKRFSREAKITAQLEHPGIVPVYDYGTTANGVQCYYTMRFVRGLTLGQVIADYHVVRGDAPHSPGGPALLGLLRQFLDVCNTISYAHSRGVIHRDIKSENIIVGEFGELVVLDWGLAKRLEEAVQEGAATPGRVSAAAARDTTRNTTSPFHTQLGEQLGTPAYMAPEQALGMVHHVDHRTDVYALAALLYEILSGRAPHDASSVEEILRAVVHDLPPLPSELCAGVPRELERICLKGLSKDRAARQQSVAELSAAVEAWMTALTDRKVAEQERERFFDLSSDLLAVIDDNGALTQSNRAWETLLGWDSAARETASFWSFVLDADRQTGRASLEPSGGVGAGEGCELRMREARGGCRWVDWRVHSSAESGRYLVGRDVTERKQAEQESEGLLESAPDATCVIDATGKIVRVNAQLERMFGYSRDQCLGKYVEVLVPKHLRARHVGHVSRFLRDPTPRPMGGNLNLTGQRANGEVFDVEVSLSPVRTGRGLLVSCSLRDVSERRRRERQLLAILNAAPDAMLVVDQSRLICHSNTPADQLFGYACGELVGQPLETLIPDRHRSVHRARVKAYTAAPTPRRMGKGQVLCGRHKDGTEIPVEISLNPVETADGTLVSCAIRPAEPRSRS